MSRHMDYRDMAKDSQHGFTKGKSCLTILLVSDGMTASADKGRAADIIYLDISKARNGLRAAMQIRTGG